MKRQLIVIAVMVIAMGSLTGCKSKEYKAAEASFQVAMSELEDKNAVLDTELTNARNLVNSDDKALDETLRPLLETAISDAKTQKVEIPEMAETADEINAQVTKMEAADYEDAIASLDAAYDALDLSIKQYALVNNPTEAYVIECLQKTNHVVDISAVTEDNDPNGHLGKQGGYTAQIYFSLDSIDQSRVSGETVIEKGTACGGSIEVYENEEDAKIRDDYLASFDGSILSNGYHTIIGTCVIRISDELPASQQKEMTELIDASLTTLE